MQLFSVERIFPVTCLGSITSRCSGKEPALFKFWIYVTDTFGHPRVQSSVLGANPRERRKSSLLLESWCHNEFPTGCCYCHYWWVWDATTHWRRRRKRYIKRDFAFFETSGGLFQLVHFVKCKRTLLELKSKEQYSSLKTERNIRRPR